MKGLAILFLVAAMIVCIFDLPQAAMVDFENTGLMEGEMLTNEITGLTFINAMIAEEGRPRVAFQGQNGWGLNDRTRAGQDFGGFFITDPLVDGQSNVPGTIVIIFDNPAREISFRVADIDNYAASRPDTFTVNAYDGSSILVETLSITVGDQGYQTGDGIATLVELSTTGISRMELSLINTLGTSGWGVDNLSYNVVPVPVPVVLFGSGLIFLFGVRKRHKLKYRRTFGW